jgi:serine/threonine protein phosphatase PrpC
MPDPSEQAQVSETPGGGPQAPPVGVRVEVSALTHRGNVRESNEDAFVVFRTGRYLQRVMSNIPEPDLPSRFEPAGHLMIVADGMGGHRAGEVASRTALMRALELILGSPKWVLKLDDPATRESEIRELLERSRGYLAGVHAAVREQAAGDSELAGMGTTLTGAYSLAADLFVLHVGDSKAFLLRGGTLRKITSDHTVAQRYADLGVIPQADVPGHRLHHVLTRAVGGPDEELEGDLHHVSIEHGDRLLLCSDGLSDTANEAELAAVLAEHPSSDAACRALVGLALQRGGRDNITAIVAGYALD